MRKSIFERLEQRFSNPVDEYIKISSFIEKKTCYYAYTIYDCFSSLFSNCEVFRKHYVDFNDCINTNIGILEQYHSYIGNNTYNNLEDSLKNDIVDSFLTYIEIIECMLCVFVKFAPLQWGSAHIDKSIIKQIAEMINESLRSINYKIIECSINSVKVIKIDPVAEYTAEQSSVTIKTAILNYLAVRDNNVEEKERALHDLIDLLEPSFKKFKSVDMISKASEYSQIVRHPEVKKSEKEYRWFYENKKEFLDGLFGLCVFTQQYVLYKKVLESFEKKKMHGE